MTTEKEKSVEIFYGDLNYSLVEDVGQIMLKGTQAAVNDPDIKDTLFQYGPSEGTQSFRDELAKFLTVEYKDEVKSSQLFFTNGATGGLFLCGSVFGSRDTPIFVDDVAFPRSVNIIKQDLKRPVVPVPSDELGTIPETFEKLIMQYKPKDAYKTLSDSPFWTLMLLVTSFHNPKGTCTAPERLRALVRLARKHRILMFCEDLTSLLYHEGDRPPPRIVQFENEDFPEGDGYTVSNGSFSKILSPAIRCGWIEGRENIIDFLKARMVVLGSGGMNHYLCNVLTHVMRMNLLSPHVQRVRTIIGNRMQTACDALQQYLPPSCSFKRPKGGICLWVKLPLELDSSVLAKHLLENYNVKVVSGEWHSTYPTSHTKNYFRIMMTPCDADVYPPAIEKIGQAVRDLTGGGSKIDIK